MVIYIRPIGAVDGDVIDWLKNDIGRFLGLEVREMANMAVSPSCLEKGRNQYNSTKILGEITRQVPLDAAKVLGVIDRDISIPILTYVFGEAQLGGVCALVSLTRLRQEFYGLEPNRQIFLERLRKESFHELGHTFGLSHCSAAACVMRLSSTVFDVDRKGSLYCRDCYEVVQIKIEAGG
jgi:archaemetzincin